MNGEKFLQKRYAGHIIPQMFPTLKKSNSLPEKKCILKVINVTMHFFPTQLKTVTTEKTELISFYLAVLPTLTSVGNAITPGFICLYPLLFQKEFKPV